MFITKHTLFNKVACLLLVSLCFTACEDDDSTATLEIPATYEFVRDGATSVSYSGQTERLDMMTALDAYMATTKSLGNVVEETTLHNMYGNRNNPFTTTFAKNLLSKTFASDTTFFKTWMSEMAIASAATVNAQDGVAGHLNEEFPAAGTTASAGYLVNEKGIEYQQIIAKGLMGAVFYYQAMEVYLTQERMGEVGNDEVAADKNYTNMEHYFDEAFGYFGIPTDFNDGDVEASADRGRYWGKYCIARHTDVNGRFGYAGINSEIMEAFKKGRGAIVAKDYVARDEAIASLSATWEKVIGSTAADYLERALSTNEAATYKRHHYMSEAIGFMLALKYKFDGGQAKFPRNSDATKINEALAIIGLDTNLYNVTDDNLTAAIDLIIAAFPAGVIR